LAAILATGGIYEGVRYWFPKWGTVAANGAAFAGFLLDYGNALPWGSVLPEKHATLMVFALTAANIYMRMRGPKQPLMGG
jgi:hypothetical protein